MVSEERMRGCLRIVGWLPIFLFAAIIIYCYYAYVVTFCTLFLIYGTPPHKTRGALYIVFGHLMLIMFIWSYVKVLITPAATTKEVPDMVMSESIDALDPRPVHIKGKILLPSAYSSYCLTCEYVKPDRSRHCRHCNKCILKFDHFCVWLNRCIGHTNYKYFILTLLYGVILGMFVSITLIQQLIYDAANGSLVWNELQMLIAFWLIFGIAVVALGLFCLHLSLMSTNTTTIERMKSGNRVGHHEYQSPYDLGSMRANFKAALGPSTWRRFLPIEDPYMSPEHAIWFPRRL